MDFYETYNQMTEIKPNEDSDFTLIEFNTDIMIGLDKNSYISVVVNSTSPDEMPLSLRTQSISIECNARVQYDLNGKLYNGIVHIIRCLSEIEKEKELFLEMALVLIEESGGSEDELLETFYILRDFFKDKNEISESELIGLYAELYTISKFHESLKIENYWQSRDRMKFDFSFPSNIKLEVKATVKDTRIHHFRHEQLTNDLYEIYVLSYCLRYDDEGLSLFDLIMECKTLFDNDSKKLIRVDYILKNVDENRLKNMKFNESFTENYRHFYRAIDIPRFKQIAPQGVVNAEYDSVLENVPYVDDDFFIDAVKEKMKEGNNVQNI